MNGHSLWMLYIFHLHVFVSIVAIIGMVLLAVWVARTSDNSTLLRRGLWIFGLGAAGVLVTVPFCLIGMSLLATR